MLNVTRGGMWDKLFPGLLVRMYSGYVCVLGNITSTTTTTAATVKPR